MKKIFLVAVMGVTAMAVNAQTTLGVKAGANFSNYKYEDSDGSDRKAGLYIGGLANIPISEMFSFQPEVVYSMEGGKEDIAGDKYELKLNYINVPFLLQYKASGFIAETGPQVGFLMNATDKFEGEDEEDVKDSFKGINFSWAIGLGYKMASGFGVNARYNIGLSNIAEEAYLNKKVKSGTIQVGVFYTFGGPASARK